MKKLLFALIFLPIVSHASNWVFVSENNTGTKFKVNTTSITRNGNEVTFWLMTNFAKRTNFGDLSSKNQLTINCLTKEFSTKYMLFFSDYDAEGTMSDQGKPPVKWTPIPPDSSYDEVMIFVCKRK